MKDRNVEVKFLFNIKSESYMNRADKFKIVVISERKTTRKKR